MSGADVSTPAVASEADRVPDPLGGAIAAIDRGDLVEARRLARDLAKSPDEATARRARDVLAQLAVDPVIVAVMLATGALIAVLAMVYLHAH